MADGPSTSKTGLLCENSQQTQPKRHGHLTPTALISRRAAAENPTAHQTLHRTGRRGAHGSGRAGIYPRRRPTRRPARCQRHGQDHISQHIAGILRPDQGDIELAGQNIAVASEGHRDQLRARHIGYIFQTFNLLQGYTCLENVLLG